MLTAIGMGSVVGTAMSIMERVVESFKLYPHLLLIKSDAVPIDESR